MNKVVSIALFGAGDTYAKYLPSWIRAHLNLFTVADGWRLRVHMGADIDKKWMSYLLDLDKAGLVDTALMCQPAEYTRGMLWRMYPVFEKAASWVFCRDLDALPMPRDLRACNEFILSQATVHTVHDNQYHVGIMGGLCGFNAYPFRTVMQLSTMDTLYAAAGKMDWDRKGADQDVLNRLVSTNPNVKLLEHRFNGWTNGNPSALRRTAGRYQCEAYSVPLADEGTAPASFGGSLYEADRLANHLGAAGYDHKAAAAFYDAHGDPNIAAVLRKFESEL